MKTGTSSAERPGVARALLIGGTLFWGLSFPLVRALELVQEKHSPHVSDFVLACADMEVRFGLAAVILLFLYGRELRRVTRLEWSQAIGLGLLASGGIYLQNLGLAWTDASISAFLTQLYTLIVPLIVALRDRRWPTLRIAIACGMVLAGAAFLSPGLVTHLVIGPGEIVTMFGTFFFAAQIVWVERPRYAPNRPGVVTLIMFALIAVVSALIYPVAGGTFRDGIDLFSTSAVWGLTLALALFCSVVSFYVMNTWQRFISATEAGLIYCVEPIIATVLCGFLPRWISGWAGIDYPNESLRWGLLAGGALIIGAAVLAATERRD
jgi:drug/metabolite transporter (DMT)-like permease